MAQRVKVPATNLCTKTTAYAHRTLNIKTIRGVGEWGLLSQSQSKSDDL